MKDFKVEITPTAHSRKDGRDLTIYKYSHGWCSSDLTKDQLAMIRDTISAHLGAGTPSEILAEQIESARQLYVDAIELQDKTRNLAADLHDLYADLNNTKGDK